tara:strand:- start:1259 stop:1453 length:195 start_codon:yes stop_codon:yes gene_type:complete
MRASAILLNLSQYFVRPIRDKYFWAKKFLLNEGPDLKTRTLHREIAARSITEVPAPIGVWLTNL